MSATESDPSAAILHFMSEADPPVEPGLILVLGRADPEVAYAAGELVVAGMAEVVGITGGIGKDTGKILDEGYECEAHRQLVALHEHARNNGYDLPVTIWEENANTRTANARNLLGLLVKHGHSLDSFTVVGHRPALRSLAATFEHEATGMTGKKPRVHRVPSLGSKYGDVDEAAAELLLLDKWSRKGWLAPQVFPPGLVDFARKNYDEAPGRPSPFLTKLLSYLPAKRQLQIIRRQAG